MEISLANERVYGDLRLTKVDEDYPDNKLTGAEFEVYRDTNGNKELDEGDELLGKLEETSTGIYEMSHILYGGVFVKETKAPEGICWMKTPTMWRLPRTAKSTKWKMRPKGLCQRGTDRLPAD